MKAYGAEDFRAAMEGPDPRAEELAFLQARLGPAAALLSQSQPLVGVLFTEQGSMEVADAMAAFEVEHVRYRFGTWVVTDDGVACLVHHFPLTQARLQETQDWAAYLAEQSWVNLWDLLRALAVARHLSLRPRHGPQGDGAHPS